MTAPVAKNPSRIFPIVVEDLGEEFGEALALLSDRDHLTYSALAKRMNQYAHWALGQGLAKGQSVCLLMPNRPEYMAIWLGLTRVGGVVSLLNTNLTGHSLAHCINIVEPKHIIIAAELMELLSPRDRISQTAPKYGRSVTMAKSIHASITWSTHVQAKSYRAQSFRL